MVETVRTGVLALVLLGGLGIYASLIEKRLKSVRPSAAKAVSRRFFRGGAVILAAAFAIGLLYRLRILGMDVAGALYIPIAAAFFYGLRWMRRQLELPEEDAKHD